ncbi:MAG: hypothetical protein ACRC6A_02810, partial [Fusobacteriaceae bacterium]
QNTILAVVNPSKLDTVFGIAGVVSEVTSNPLVGRYTFNSFLLQSTYFATKIDHHEHITEIVTALLATYYNKTEVNTLLNNLKTYFEPRVAFLEGMVSSLSDSINDTYSKNEINTKLHDKMDVSQSYNRVEIDGKLARKVDVNSLYSNSVIDSKLDLKADKTDITGNNVKEFRANPLDKRVLEIVMEDDTVKSLDLTESLANYIGKGGMRLLHLLKSTSFENSSYDGKFEVDSEFPLDISVADTSKRKAGRISLHRKYGKSFIRINEDLCTVSFTLSTEGRWRPFGDQLNTGTGEFTVELIVYQKPASRDDDTWAKVISTEITNQCPSSDKYSFILQSSDIRFTTANEPTDISLSMKIKSLPEGANTTGEHIRFGLVGQLVPEGKVTYQDLYLVYEQNPQKSWNKFEVIEEAL